MPVEKPENEKQTRNTIPEDLVNEIKRLFAEKEQCKIKNYWLIGQKIIEYKLVINSDVDACDLGNMTGMSSDTLYKCRQFADKYTEEQVDALFNGQFVMSWHLVYHYLTLNAADIVETYQYLAHQSFCFLPKKNKL